jgi:hypothetical protein
MLPNTFPAHVAKAPGITALVNRRIPQAKTRTRPHVVTRQIPRLEKAMARIETKENSVVAVYPLHSEAESAINLLQKNDFNIRKLAVVGQGYHSDDQVVGYYTTGDRMKHWGKNGAFWGGVWGMLVGSAFFLIPGVGPVIVAGSAVAWVVAALEGAVVVGGLSALGAALYSIGIPRNSVIKYETSLKAGKFLLIANGTAEEADFARRILATTDAEEINVHEPNLSNVAA